MTHYVRSLRVGVTLGAIMLSITINCLDSQLRNAANRDTPQVRVACVYILVALDPTMVKVYSVDPDVG